MNTPSPSLASQTVVEMMAIMMVLVLNMRNMRERSALMAMVIVCHKELETQRTNMMAMAIINLEKHERMTIHTMYEHEWTWALGFSCVAYNSFYVNLKSAN